MIATGAKSMQQRAWCSCAYYVIACQILIVLHSVASENLLTNFEIRHGYIYPPSVIVAEGEVMHLRLLVPMQEGDRCVYREPGSPIDIDVHGGNPPLDGAGVGRRNNVNRGKLLRFGEQECSIRVSPVHQRDAGFWRLTLMRGTERIRGVTMVDVIQRPTVPEVGIGTPGNAGSASVTSMDEISPERTEYCYVHRQGESTGDGSTHGAGSVPMHEHCQLPLTQTDPTGAGVWSVVAGVQGQMREMTYGIQIENKEEHIITAIHRESDYHVLSCSLLHTELTIKFCRFLRLSDGLGLNVIPGVGLPRYGYIGAGFERNECGLEILGPESLDKGPWKCLLGYGDETLTKVAGALVDNSDGSPPLAIIGLEDTVVAQNATVASLFCNANKPIDYCWFRGPHGQFYSLSESLTPERNDGQYWYSGVSLAMGECGIAFGNILDTDHAGQWQCYVGNGHISALEVSAVFQVRISPSQMISRGDLVEAETNAPTLLGCDSIPRGTPLQYCRFVTPNGHAFSLNENMTTDAPILERFYSNPNHNLAKGSCSLVIASVRSEDFGEWFCAGKIEGHPMEHITGIILHDRNEQPAGDEREGGENLSAASIVGMAIGAVAVAIGAIGVGFWQFRKRLHRQTTAVNQEIQMRTIESTDAPDVPVAQRLSVVSSVSDGSSTDSQKSHHKLQTTF